jgi:hypothetical protein
MKGFDARRIRVRIAEVWQTPALHVLLTREDDMVVARCLDFTVSSHGENEREALASLAAAIKEYILTAIENNAVDTIFDPAQGKYWRMFNEIEAKRSASECKRSINKSLKGFNFEVLQKSAAEISYA